MRTQTIEADVIVVGGGLAGVSAAVAAARLGRRTVLINNRPVLGGNSSSEVRVWVCGATAHGNQRWARETGIMGEMLLENQYRNPEGNPVYWDDVVLDTVRREPNLTLFLNTEVLEAEAHGPDDDRRITSVTGWTMGSEIRTIFRGPVFLDCTGDGLVGRLVGARHRLGKESRAEFGEEWAPEEPIREFLGSTLLFYTKDVGYPVKYVAPETAKDIGTTPIPTTRIIRSGDSGAHYWWIEWGGQLDIVDDNEQIRDELRSVILGIWDHIKNSGEFDADNLTLEWIGNIPGKREYRRFVGDYTLRQQDILEQTEFDDGVAFGGWSIDLHPAEGMYASGAGAVQRFSDGVFEIPFRSLYSVNVSNLLMAGRNISASHIAFGAARVMATCAAMGEAAGTAASLCLVYDETPRELYENHRAELRQALLRADASLIGVANEDPGDLARSATVTASGWQRHLTTAANDSQAMPHELTEDLGIVLPVDPELQTIDLLLSSERESELTVEVWSTGKRQNFVPVTLEHSTTVVVPAGGPGWVTANVPFAPRTPQNAVVVLRAAEGVSVYLTDTLPAGVLTLVHRVDNDDQNVEIADEGLLVRWPTKPLRGSVPIFRAFPETAALAPQRAVSGFNRPFGGPNMWASDPLNGDSAWLRLDWDAPTTAKEIRLVFDDDVDISLNTLHHHRNPDEIIPQLVRDYRVEVLREHDMEWATAVEVHGNRHRHRVHSLSSELGAFTAARLVVEATNGAAEARVIAFRVQS